MAFAPPMGQQGPWNMKGRGGMSWKSEGGWDVVPQHCHMNSARDLVLVIGTVCVCVCVCVCVFLYPLMFKFWMLATPLYRGNGLGIYI